MHNNSHQFMGVKKKALIICQTCFTFSVFPFNPHGLNRTLRIIFDSKVDTVGCCIQYMHLHHYTTIFFNLSF